MISPQEFAGATKNTHLGAFRYEADRSFIPMDKIKEYGETRKFAEDLMNSQNLPAIRFIAHTDEPES